MFINFDRPHVTMADFEKPYRLDDMPLIDRRYKYRLNCCLIIIKII